MIVRERGLSRAYERESILGGFVLIQETNCTTAKPSQSAWLR